MDNGACSYRRFLSGDDEGLREIIDLYQDGLILYLNSIVQNIHTAEDLAEETLAVLVIKQPKFSGKSSFKTWLYAIARNTARMYLRKHSVQICVPDEISEDIVSSDNVEERLLRGEENKLIYNSLKSINSEYGQVIYLSYFENLSNEETAVIMKKTRRQIESLLYNAKKALKINLERSGFEYGKP